MSKLITHKQLEDKQACEDQLELFKHLFGDEVKLTLEVVKEHGHKFDIQWAANMLLSKEALAEYERVRDAALAEYKRVLDAALAEYKRVEGPALAEYEQVEGPAWAEYKRKCAITFYELYNYKEVKDVHRSTSQD